MPINVIDGQKAWDAYYGTRGAAWPRKPDEKAYDDPDRLFPVCYPIIQIPEGITQAKKWFTTGSCFARNIETSLASQGMNVLSDIGNTYHNKYNVFSIENEFRLCCEDVSDEELGEMLFEHPDGTYRDYFSTPHNLLQTYSGDLFKEVFSYENILKMRRDTVETFKKFKEADVIVITLGLAEAWYDNKLKTYINVTPDKALVQDNPERYSLHILSYDDIFQSLERTYKRIREHTDAYVLLTVSPVALSVSFSSKDIVQANCYSKSVQRAAVEGFCDKYKENVFYYPSYESVIYSDMFLSWETDYNHPSQFIVDVNVGRLIAALTGGDANDIDGLVANTAGALNDKGDYSFKRADDIEGLHKKHPKLLYLDEYMKKTGEISQVNSANELLDENKKLKETIAALEKELGR